MRNHHTDNKRYSRKRLARRSTRRRWSLLGLVSYHLSAFHELMSSNHWDPHRDSMRKLDESRDETCRKITSSQGGFQYWASCSKPKAMLTQDHHLQVGRNNLQARVVYGIGCPHIIILQFPYMEVPQNRWLIMENPIYKWMTRVPPFRETSI